MEKFILTFRKKKSHGSVPVWSDPNELAAGFEVVCQMKGTHIQGASYVLGQAIMPSALYSVMILNSS